MWLIEAHKQYLIWGNQQQQKQKQTFIKRSKKRLYRNVGILGGIGLLAISAWGWLNYTTAGQLWQIRRDLMSWSRKVNDKYQSQAAIAFAKDGEIKQSYQLLTQIDDSDYKAYALSAIAEATSQLKDSNQAVTVLKQALTTADTIDSSSDKARALSAIAEAQASLQQWGDALKTTRQCLSHDCRVDSLSKVLTVYAEFENPELKKEE